MSKKILWAGVGVATLSLAALGYIGYKNHQTKPLKEIHFGYQPGHAQITVALAKGWLQQEFASDSVKIIAQSFAAGPPIIEAITGNRLDFGQVGDQPALQALANGVKIKAIGIYAASRDGNGIVVSPQSHIQSVADLKGKKVGVTIGSSGHIVLISALKENKIPSSEVNIVNLGPGDILTAFRSGQIEAVSTWEPYLSLLKQGGAIPLAQPESKRLLVNPIVVTEKFATAYPTAVTRLLKVLQKSQEWIIAQPDSALQLIAKESGYKPELLAPLFKKSVWDLHLNEEAIQSITQSAQILRETGALRTDVDVKNFVSQNFWEK